MVRPLRVAMVVDVFPRVENTFVVDQLTGLIDRGVALDLFAMNLRDPHAAAPEVVRYRLLERNRYLHFPAAKLPRLLTALKLLADRRHWHPATWDSLHPRYGKRAWSLSQLYTTLSFLRAPAYDIVHCQFGYLGPLLVPLVRHRVIGGKLVVAFRGADLSKVLAANPRFYQPLWRHGDLFLPVSDYFRQRLLGLGVPPDKVALLRSGINLQHFPYRERVPARERFELLFVGRLTELKGVFDAVAALKLARRHGVPLRLTILGDGELRGELAALVAREGLQEAVVMKGAVPRPVVAEHLAQAHALIAPSRTGASGVEEGVPTVLMEAMASGLPVVSTYHSGIPELVEHGVSGLLAPEGDVATLAAHLSYLYRYPDAGRAMGQAGRRKIEREYDNTRLTAALEQLYHQLLGRAAPAEAA